MKKETIDSLIKIRVLRLRQKDIQRIKSLLNSSETTAKVAKNVPLSDESSTLIFRELYESIRQLGDAYWWCLGYEPLNHDISFGSLKDMEIAQKLKLNYLDRFRKIRNDANYRGFKISIPQTKEIIEFWDSCANDIIKVIKKNL